MRWLIGCSSYRWKSVTEDSGFGLVDGLKVKTEELRVRFPLGNRCERSEGGRCLIYLGLDWRVSLWVCKWWLAWGEGEQASNLLAIGLSCAHRRKGKLGEAGARRQEHRKAGVRGKWGMRVRQSVAQQGTQGTVLPDRTVQHGT